MKTLPVDAIPYKSSPVFTDDTVPAALLRNHTTADGTWGRITIIAGALLYRITDARRAPEEVLLTPERFGVVEPGIEHAVEVVGPVRFQVDFHRSAAATSAPADLSPATLVDALNNTFGRHPGKRASHAKGCCAVGSFTPAPEAAQFVAGPLFSSDETRCDLRFSVGGGNPAVSDKSRSVRGLSLRTAAGADRWDLLLVSEPVFFAATPASFVSFLAARVADPATKKPDPAKVAAHNAHYPDGVLQAALLAAHPAPASYASTPYFSNNAFVFIAPGGARTTARIVVTPVAGTHYLAEDDERQFPDDFLEAELAARLAHAPVEFDIVAQLPAAGDSLTDPSQRWTGAGRVALGRLRVTALAEIDACDGLVFVPVNLPSGMAPSDDPILLARAAAYGVSLARRRL